MAKSTDNVIPFRGRSSKKSAKPRKKPVRSYDTIKYFTKDQINLIRRTARENALLATKRRRSRVTPIRVWMVIDLMTSTGVRVSEAANIRCGDIKVGYAQSELFVRDGKGSISRTIQIPKILKQHLKQYLKWKKSIGEPTGPNDHLLIGQRGPMTRPAIQQLTKRLLKKIGIYETGMSCHALRHSYAVQLYRQQRDLRAVQKQLGHAHISTTIVYADTLKEDIQDQLNGLWR